MLASHNRQLHEYVEHICKVLLEPKKFGLHEREMKGFKQDLISTLKQIDDNTGKMIGRIAYEDVKHEAFSTTFKIDQYFDFHVFINNKSPKE
jgi:hypothetical protein